MNIVFSLFKLVPFLFFSVASIFPPGFSILDQSFNAGMGPDAGVTAMALQPDGKILISGQFTTVHGISRNHIARLNEDGSLDTSFDIGSGPNGDVFKIALQPDGKVILGGSFTEISGSGLNSIARLNPDGSLDTTFSPGSGVDWWVLAIILQQDGKILIGGSFSTVDNIPRNNIARLDVDGSLDSTFDPGSGTNSAVKEILLLPDNDIMIGGDFTLVNGEERSYVARLNPDGSVDPSFQVSFEGLSAVSSLLLQPDNKLLIGGTFTQINGVLRNGIARVNLDGSLDTTFDPGQGITNGSLLSMALQNDGKILVGGFFAQVDGVACNRIARLLRNGSLDTSFNINSGFDAGVKKLLVQPDQNILVSGWFTKFDNISKNYVARILTEKLLYMPALLK